MLGKSRGWCLCVVAIGMHPTAAQCSRRPGAGRPGKASHFLLNSLTIAPHPARVAKLVDARDLSKLSTRRGNGRCEWGQIRGNSTTCSNRTQRDCNPELSPAGRKRLAVSG